MDMPHWIINPARSGQQGFVLLIVLIFMQLFSALSLFSMASVSARIKLTEKKWRRLNDLQQARTILTSLEWMQLINQQHCLVAITPALELARQPNSWWEGRRCGGNFNGMQYHYVLELLGQDVCADMGKDIDNQQLIAKYYRITLHIKQTKHSKLVLQSAVAVPDVAPETCHAAWHHVAPGRQMWREL